MTCMYMHMPKGWEYIVTGHISFCAGLIRPPPAPEWAMELVMGDAVRIPCVTSQLNRHLCDNSNVQSNAHCTDP